MIEGDYKILKKDGFVIKGLKTTEDKAYKRAMYVIDTLLTNLPYVRRSLSEMEYKVVIVSTDMKLTDFPEYQEFLGQSFHQRTAGKRQFDNVEGMAERVMCAVNESPSNAYISENAFEYFAVATESWFNSYISKQGINGGIHTRELIQQHDPLISELLYRIYGDIEVKPY